MQLILVKCVEGPVMADHQLVMRTLWLCFKDGSAAVGPPHRKGNKSGVTKDDWSKIVTNKCLGYRWL